MLKQNQVPYMLLEFAARAVIAELNKGLCRHCQIEPTNQTLMRLSAIIGEKIQVDPVAYTWPDTSKLAAEMKKELGL